MSDPEILQIIIIGFAVSIPLGIIAFIYLKQKSNKLKGLLESAAIKWNGEVVISQLEFYPLLKVVINGHEVIISFRMERKQGGMRIPPSTIVKTNFMAAPAIELIVLKKTLLSQLAEKLAMGIGMKVVPLGDSKFDDMFVVKSIERTMVSAILDAEVQRRLLQLFIRHPSLRIKGKSFRMELQFIPDNVADFDPIIGLVQYILEKF